MNRRRFLLAACAAAPLAVAGCATQALWSPDIEEKEETVNAFLISQDEKTFVVIGHRYHYLFRAMPALVAVLKSSFRSRLAVEPLTVTVKKDQSVSGHCALTLSGADAETETQAQRLGFTKAKSGALTITLPLNGTRYAAPPEFSKAGLQNFSKEYPVKVREEQGPNPGKLLATPLTLALDGALMLLGAPLLIVMLCAGKPHACG